SLLAHRPAAGHALDPEARLERPYQHGPRLAVAAGDDVEAVVDSIDEVDVGVARRTEHHGVARRGSGPGVARGVLGSAVGLDLDDAPRHHTVPVAVDQPASEEIARHRAHVAREERAAGAALAGNARHLVADRGLAHAEPAQRLHHHRADLLEPFRAARLEAHHHHRL